MTLTDWLGLDRRGLAAALRGGHAVSADALAGQRYLGISLGLPAWIERLSWKTFEKDFWRDRDTGQIRGWNVRLAQTGWEGPPEPLTRGDVPRTFGHFHVLPGEQGRRSEPVPGSLLLDYGAGGNAALDPVGRVRDPLVAVSPGSADTLLGWTWLDLGATTLGTPSYFLLTRIGPVEHVP